MDYRVIMNVIMGSSMMAGILAVLIFLAKFLFNQRLGSKWHYGIWLILLIRLLIPYLGFSPFNLSDMMLKDSKTSTVNVQYQNDENVSGGNLRNVQANGNETASLNQDTKGNSPFKSFKNFFTQSSFKSFDYTLLFMIWASGAILLIVYALIYNMWFWFKVKNGAAMTDPQVIRLMEECKGRLNVGTNIAIVQTSGINIPAIFGVVRPWLLLPDAALKRIGYEGLRHVMLHELAHMKRKDILINWIAFFLQIVHWFNPLVWFAFHRMRADRELACDAFVLSRLDAEERKKYGHTLLDMAELVSKRIHYAGIAGILENKSQIKARIIRIAGFDARHNALSALVVLIFILFGSTIMVNANKIYPDYGRIETLSEGVQDITFIGIAGLVVNTDDAWTTVISSDDDMPFAMARIFGKGRIIAFGHDNVFNDTNIYTADNKKYFLNAIKWLSNGTSDRITLALTTGHNEWMRRKDFFFAEKVLKKNNCLFKEISAPISEESLMQNNIVIAGNAWGSFSDSELLAFRHYVENGGSLMLFGLGWSYDEYHPDKSIDTYPMNQLGKVFGMRWITDMTPTLGSGSGTYVIFKNFYKGGTNP